MRIESRLFRWENPDDPDAQAYHTKWVLLAIQWRRKEVVLNICQPRRTGLWGKYEIRSAPKKQLYQAETA
jgi:hypothetical protein